MTDTFEGLHAAVSEKLNADVRGGAIFAFTTKRRTRPRLSVFKMIDVVLVFINVVAGLLRRL